MSDQGFIRYACGKLYKWMLMYVGDQSMCPSCRAKLQQEYEQQEAK